MSRSPKHLTELSFITWAALVAFITFLLSLIPLWITYLVLYGSVLGLAVVSDEARRAKAHRIRKAMDICGYSLTTAARTAEMDIADFSRMLTDPTRKLDEWRLEMLGDEFMRTLALLELQERGLPEFARTALKIEPALSALARVRA